MDTAPAASASEPAAQQGTRAAAKRGKGQVFRVPPPTPPGAEAEKPRNKGGRPAHAPTAETRRQVEAMAMRFLSRESIAAILGVSADTLRKHYVDELALGDAKAEMHVCDGLHRLAQKGNAAALIFLAKVRLGWSEKLRHEHSGPEGDPIKVFLAKSPAQRRAELEGLAARGLGPEPDPAADGFDADGFETGH